MKISLLSKIGLFLILSLMLAGCRVDNVQPVASTQEVHVAPNTPFSKGPTSPPSVKGPSMPLPGVDGVVTTPGQPQAMTESVNKKFAFN